MGKGVSGEMRVWTENFVEPKANGEEGLEHKCKSVEAEGWTIVSIEEGMIPQAGSMVPGALNYGMTEPGWTIVAERPHPKDEQMWNEATKAYWVAGSGHSGANGDKSSDTAEWPWREEPDPEKHNLHYLYG